MAGDIGRLGKADLLHCPTIINAKSMLPHHKTSISASFEAHSPAALPAVELIFDPKLASERNEGDAEQTTDGRMDDISFLG